MTDEFLEYSAAAGNVSVRLFEFFRLSLVIDGVFVLCDGSGHTERGGTKLYLKATNIVTLRAIPLKFTALCIRSRR